MSPPTVSIVLVIVLGLTATLPAGPTVVHAEGGSASGEVAKNTTREGEDNQCSPLQRRQDLLDSRLNERESRLNGLDTRLSSQLTTLEARLTERDTRQNDLSRKLIEVDTRFNRMDGRLDGIEIAISDMKAYLQQRMEAMDKKMEWALTDIKPRQDVTATEKAKVYRGCEDALAHGMTVSGVYTPADCDNSKCKVYCEQLLDGGGWTVFQSRHNGTVDFYQDWDAYRTGFGDLRGEFWLGNENIWQLTKHHDKQLKIELTSPEGEVKYADYGQFWIAGAADKFRLTATGYSGGSPPGDSMANHNGQQFSTKDADNDGWSSSCAASWKGGWWYNDCHHANLNGVYGSTVGSRGLNWNQWKGYYVSMKATRMMFRKRP